MSCKMRFNSILSRLPLPLPLPRPRWPMLLYAASWTSILTVTVAMASFTPEIAFVSAVTPTSSLSQACSRAGAIRLPLDLPSQNFCFPASLLKRSRIDILVPPIFAAVIVTTSAFAVKAMGLWEAEDDHF